MPNIYFVGTPKSLLSFLEEYESLFEDKRREEADQANVY